MLGVAGLLVLIFARVPIAIALAASGLFGYAALDGWPKALKMLGSVPFNLASAYSLSVVPLFILMGAVASRANMARELFEASNAIFSGIRGALASATIGACAAFGAICGSSIATAATFSRVSIPEMRRYGYDEGFAAGAVASAGTLGILIPPSVMLAIYSIVAEQSLPKLFAAAMVPGMVLAVLYVVTVTVIARLRPDLMPKAPSMPLAQRLRAARSLWKLALLFFLAVVGIYLGWFSPTEAAAVSSFAAIVIAFATRAMKWRGLFDALLETAYATAMLFFIVVGAFIFARFVVLTQFPNILAQWVQAAGLAPAWIEQAGAFADGTEHPGGATLSVCYVAVLPRGEPMAPWWWMETHALTRLPERHRRMVTAALGVVRVRLEQAPIAFNLLPREFTLSELQQAYETVLGRRLHKASFRRALQAAFLVEPTGEWRGAGRGRPAQLYRYAPRRRKGARRGVRLDLL